MNLKFKTNDFLKFLIIFIFTIVLYRLLILVIGDISLVVLGHEVHHLYLGVLLVLLAGFSRFFSKSKQLNKFDLAFFAIGAGMIADEVIFLIFTPAGHEDYFSPISVWGAVILSLTLILAFCLIFKEEQNMK